MKFCTNHWTGSFMIGITNFTEILQNQKRGKNNFSRSRNFNFTCIHFNFCECLKW